MIRKLLIMLVLISTTIAVTACGGGGGGGSSNGGTTAPYVPVQSISVEPATMTLDPNITTSPIVPIFNPLNATNKALTYTSSNPDNVSVSANGELTTNLANSTATITITSVDNSSATATVAVTVRASAIGYNIINGVWEIYNADGLKVYRDSVNIASQDPSAKLMADITLDSTEEWTPIGSSSDAFSSTFDGNGKTITGLKISIVGSEQGLFSNIKEGAVVKNLGLIAPNITAGESVGGIAGENSGTIIACYVSGGTVTGTGENVGGIAGGNSGGAIIATYVKGTNVTGGSNFGAIIGINRGFPKVNFYQDVTGNVMHGIGSDVFASSTPSNTNTEPTTDIKTNINALNSALSAHTHEYVINGDLLTIQQKANAPTLPSIDSEGYYLVDSAHSLSIMRDHINLGNTKLNIRLTQNIDLSNIAWEPMHTFAGIFDGNGKTIANMRIEKTEFGIYGLFSTINRGGIVKNLGMVNPSVNVTGAAGTIAGSNDGIIVASYVINGAVKGSFYAGGVVASSSGALIASYVSGTAVTSEGGIAIGLTATNTSKADIRASFYNVSGVKGVSDDSDNLLDDVVGQFEATTDIKTNIDALNNALRTYTHEYIISGNTLALKQKETSPLPSLVNGYYEVRTAGELRTMVEYINFSQANLNTNIKLMADIDLNNEEWTPIGAYDSSGDFKEYIGTFDGNGHTITGLKITSTISYQGLFAMIDKGGVVKNLGLISPSITATSNVGAIAGQSNGTITATYVSGGTITGETYVGGLVGYNNGGKITASYVSGTTFANVNGFYGAITGHSDNSGTLDTNYYNVSDVAIKGVGNSSVGLPDVADQFETTTDIKNNVATLNAKLSAHDFEYYVKGEILALRSSATSPLPSLVDGYYEVNTADELRIIRNYINKVDRNINVKLMADIDLTGDTWTPIATEHVGYGGTFDGNGKVIAWLTMNAPTFTAQGLFGGIDANGIVKNLGLISATVTGKGNVGGIAGVNNGTIIACYVGTSTIEAKGTELLEGVASGGIVGTNKGTITATYMQGSVTAASATYAGGIVGYNNNGSLTENFYSVVGIASTVAGQYTSTTNVADNIDALNSVLTFNTHEYVMDGSTLKLQEKSGAIPTLPSVVDGYYQINTADELNTIVSYINSGNANTNVKLVADITLNSSVAWTMIRSYGGTFDGNGKTITGFMLNGTADEQAMFINISANGVVKHLGLISPQITGGEDVGSIAVINKGEIIACYMKDGTINSTITNSYTGGLVAENRGKITASYVIGGEVKGTGAISIGGIAGYSRGDITATYVSGTQVTATSTQSSEYVQVGGIAGNKASGTFSYNYYQGVTIVGDDGYGVGYYGNSDSYSDTVGQAEKADTIEALNGKVDGMNTALGSDRVYGYIQGSPTTELPTVVKVNP